MKKSKKLASFATLFLASAVLFSIGAATLSAQEQQGSPAGATATNRPNPTGDGTAPAGLVSGVINLLPGQTLRVAAVNAGQKELPLQIYIIPVSPQGKADVPIQCNATPAPGDAAIDQFSIPDGTSNRLLYVQIRVQTAKDVEDLVPSLEVFNTQAGSPGPHFLLSGADFAEIRPIWVP